jgi:glycosyltransferase involved in cell wall biosynthesis
MLKRLAIITTHPIQYNAPLFKLLQQRGRIEIRVFYTWGADVLKDKYDPGFNQSIKWDIPVLDGYAYTFEQNIAKEPGSHHFKGIDNPGLVKNIWGWGADAVLLYGWSFKSHLQVLRHFHNKKTVLFRGDSTIVDKRHVLKEMPRHLFLKWVYSKVDYALYVGAQNKRYYEACGLKSRQLLFAPHAIDNERFMFPAAGLKDQAHEKRKELGIGEADMVFLFAGKLDKNKNAQLLLDAFLCLDNARTHLIIAGSGKEEQALRLAAGGHSRIHFLPFQNQQFMPVLYRMGDVFVLPSVSETWGLAISEAMACGKAVLVSDTCGAAVDLVHPGINGYTFSCRSRQSLQDKMDTLSQGREQLAKMGQQSAQLIAEWNYEKTCQVIEAVLEES